MNTTLQQAPLLVQSLGIALLHSVWQCLVIYLLLVLVVKLLGGNSQAKTRYTLSMLSLAGMCGWFITTWVSQWQRLQGINILVSQSSDNPATARTIVLNTMQHSSSHSFNYYIEQFFSNAGPYIPLMVWAYAAGILLMLARIGRDLYHVKQLRNSGMGMMEEQWLQWLEEKRLLLNIKVPVQLMYSFHVRVPMMTGFLKPIILLPIAMASRMGSDQLEAILLHELAHIKRQDYLLNIFQSIAETMLFFNPFMWLTSAIARSERELCCDDLVLAYSTAPLSYAKALASLESYRCSTNALVMAASGKKQKLFHRIKRIMEMKNQKTNYVQAFTAIFIFIAIVICAAWMSPSFAQSSKNKSKTQSSHKQSYAPAPVVREESNDDGYSDSKAPKHRSYEEEGDDIAPVDPYLSQADREELEHSKEETSRDMADMDRDMTKANKELEEAGKELAAIDWGQINKEMEAAGKEMAAVDWDQINKEMAMAGKELAAAGKELDAIDWDAIGKTVDESMKTAMASVNDPKVRKELAKARAEQAKAMAEARKAASEARANAHKAMADARVQAAKQRSSSSSHSSYNVSVSGSGAGKHGDTYVTSSSNGKGYNYAYSGGGNNSTNSTSMNKMLAKMEAEGLLKRADGYNIRKDGNKLYINGKEQGREVLDRYKGYLKSEHMAINGDEDNLNISAQD